MGMAEGCAVSGAIGAGDAHRLRGNQLASAMDQYEQDASQDGSDTKKQNHSEIEKRRRDKMNRYITELSKIVPVCGGMSRKLDKLTVLRMAVQHMKTIRGNMNAFASSGQLKPSFLSDNNLYDLILQVGARATNALSACVDMISPLSVVAIINFHSISNPRVAMCS